MTEPDLHISGNLTLQLPEYQLGKDYRILAHDSFFLVGFGSFGPGAYVLEARKGCWWICRVGDTFPEEDLDNVV